MFMKKIFPKKLQAGDEVRIVAPSRSLGIISPQVREIANQRLEALGFKFSFGKHVEEMDEFASSSIESRVADIHEAFADPNVRGIMAVIGGFNANQLLRYLDWDLIQKNSKVFCGYSDTTALANAIFAKTGLVNYSGPSYSSFGKQLYFDYTLENYKKCIMSEAPYQIVPSQEWSDNEWYKDQTIKEVIQNEGYWVINEGEARGTVLGANLCTFNLLQGTEYFPDLKDSVLFLEDDHESQGHHFDRDLQSLIHLPNLSGVKGIVIGRFQIGSKVTKELLTKIIKTKKELANLPVIANADFGHTDPKTTFPIGGDVKISATSKGTIEILKH